MTKKNTAKTGEIKSQKKNEATAPDAQSTDVVTENSNNDTATNAQSEKASNGDASNTVKKEVSKKKSARVKTAQPKSAAKKPVTANNKTAVPVKKVRLVSSCYHYYRNVLRDWLRDHKVPSARFMKNPENYDGYITVLENEKVQALKALAQYRKENPDVKDLWKELRK